MARKDKTKVTLARMTHGTMRRVNDVLYITDYPDTDLQHLVNIETGMVLEEIYVDKRQRYNRKPNEPIKYNYRDTLVRCRNGIVLSKPKDKIGNWSLKIYNKRGACIFVLKDVTGVGHYVAPLENERTLIVLRDNINNYYVLVWDDIEQKITDNFIGVDKFYLDGNVATIREFNKEKGMVIHKYKLNGAGESEL